MSSSDCVNVLPDIQRVSLYNGQGHVELIDVMPRLVPTGRTCDIAICRSARISTGNADKTISEDVKLIRYLYNHHHTSPFESISFKFKMKIPIFVERQLSRHRTAKQNQSSSRYSEMKDSAFFPDLRMQCHKNKQSSIASVPVPDEAQKLWKESQNLNGQLYQNYKAMLDQGVAREVARCILPVAYMTEIIWKIDLHNLLHFLKLRTASDAQLEIRVLADAMFELIKPLVPIACQAFEDANSIFKK